MDAGVLGKGKQMDAAYTWPLWRYEMVCTECGAHFFMPDGECCLCCGGDSLRTLSQAVLQMRMSAEDGEVICI